MNTGAEVTICHMLGKHEENPVSYLQVFLVSSNISFFLWVKTFAICLVMIGQWYSRQPW